MHWFSNFFFLSFSQRALLLGQSSVQGWRHLSVGTQVHGSACSQPLCKALARARETNQLPSKDPQHQGAAVCRVYFAGAAIIQLGTFLVVSAPFVGPWSRMPIPWLAPVRWDFGPLQANDGW